MPVQQHCQLTSQEPHSALFSCSVEPEILLFLLLGFLSCSPCHCGGSLLYYSADLTQPALALLWRIMFTASLCTHCRECSNVSVQVHISTFLEAQAGFVYMLQSVVQNLLLEAQNTGWRKLEWAQKRAEQSKHKSKTQVETIPDESPICFHFRVWVLN